MKAVALALFAACCSAGCSKKDAPPQRTEPWLAHPSASASSGFAGAPLDFHFTPDSNVRFTVLGRRGKVSGRVALVDGTLRLDPRDLKNSSASLDVDLTKISIDAEGLPEGVAGTPNALALQWLELGPDVAPERRREFSRARFELTSIETSSANSLDFGTRRSPSHVRATVVGTLLIHGFRAPVRCDVVISSLESAPGTAQRLSIRSVGPLVIALAQHDIVARGPSGIADPLATARSTDWVGKNAKVELELSAQADVAAVK